jgi:hypothetical protein
MCESKASLFQKNFKYLNSANLISDVYTCVDDSINVVV